MAIDSILDECRDRMSKSLDALKRELTVVRTGRANPALVEAINVNYYDVETPLNQLATITVPEARGLQIPSLGSYRCKRCRESYYGL